MDIIYFSFTSWDDTPQRTHHIARYLSCDNRVLFVNPAALSILGYLRNQITGNRKRNLLAKLARINNGLYVLYGPPLLHFSDYYSAINFFNHWVIESVVRKYLDLLHFHDYVLWITLPLQIPVVGKFGETAIVYDCMDNYPAFYLKGSKQERLMKNLEIQLETKADVIFCTSSTLYNRIQQRNPSTVLMPNAVSDEFINYAPFIDENNDMPKVSGPILGFIGTIYDWVDLNLLVDIAIQRPNWTILMVGPIHTRLPQTKFIPNLLFLGSKPYKTVPQYVSRFDVCLIPFKINEITVDVNPVKLYEYFAFGKPVVSSALPEVEKYKNLCYIACSADDFINQIELALEEKKRPDCNKLINTRKEIASDNTWEKRVQNIVSVLRNITSSKSDYDHSYPFEWNSIKRR